MLEHQSERLAAERGRWFRREFVIDLGSSHTVLASGPPSSVFREPTLVAVKAGGPAQRGHAAPQVVAVGSELLDSQRGAMRQVDVVAPVRRGRIDDVALSAQVLQKLARRVAESPLRRMMSVRVGALLVPPDPTEREQAAYRTLMRQVGLRRFMLVDMPTAAAIGCGLDTRPPRGRMVMDFGGGKCLLAGFSMGSLVSWHRIDFGGQDLDEAILRYVEGRFAIHIQSTTAERIKCTIGSVHPKPKPQAMEISGADPRGGLDKAATVRDSEIRDVLVDACEPLVMGLHKGFETMPPELAGDILEDGITIVGGGALLDGLSTFLRERTGIPFQPAADPMNAVVAGAVALLRQELALRGWRRRMKI